MIITDLFSHKIHSSKPEWAEKLVELACVFAEFDNQIYDRNKIEQRLQKISPRATFIARDPSKFRDEISAYPAYLGLYHLVLINNQWVLRLSETAKRYLTNEEPNVSAFLLLQLTLFQYPCGMGIAYTSNSNKIRVQANTRDRTLEFIQNGIHICPLRLICKGLEADSILKNINILDASISSVELFTLANEPSTNQKTLPALEAVIEVLDKSRNGYLFPPDHFENRLHILNHTNFIQTNKKEIKLREVENEADKLDIYEKFEALTRLSIEFNGFDNILDEEDFEDLIKRGSWAEYFDSLLTLSAETVEILTRDTILDGISQKIPPIFPFIKEDRLIEMPIVYPLRKRSESISPYPPIQSRKIQLADPEVTKIKRQRSNLSHKLTLQKLDEYLRKLGAELFQNEHIDLFVKIPSDGKYLFEVKSIADGNLLSQSRKGLSQLYEYRFRYKTEIGYDTTLCLVFSNEPIDINISWLQEYLCTDRNVAVIWFSQNGELMHSQLCRDLIQPLLMSD